MRIYHTTTSKCLSYRAGIVTNRGNSLEYYGPRYKLEVLSNNMDDYNSKEYLNGIK